MKNAFFVGVKILLSVVLLSSVGCGITKLAEETRDQVTHTNDQLNTSNDKQTQLLEATKRLQDLTTQLLAGIQTTNNAIHLQVLTVALQELLSPANTESLTPPARMFPYAETLAREATAEELIQLYHTFLVDVIYGGTTDKDKPNDKDLRITSRRISLAASSVIAAFISEAKLKEILKVQIEQGGRFEDSAYVLCLTRYTYLKDFFFSSIVEKSERVNMDSVRKAADYFTSMKALSTLPYVDRLKLHVPSFIVVTEPGTNNQSFHDFDLSLEPKEVAALARKALRRFHRDEKLKKLLETTEEGKALTSKFQ